MEEFDEVVPDAVAVGVESVEDELLPTAEGCVGVLAEEMAEERAASPVPDDAP